MRRYCAYCGRVAHRCICADADSRLRRFLARAEVPFTPLWRDGPYKRGVPPQVKRRERAALRAHYQAWYAELAAQYGDKCQHCGNVESLVLDHVVPVALGGGSVVENLQILCAGCNTAKGKLAFDCRGEPPGATAPPDAGSTG